MNVVAWKLPASTTCTGANTAFSISNNQCYTGGFVGTASAIFTCTGTNVTEVLYSDSACKTALGGAGGTVSFTTGCTALGTTSIGITCGATAIQASVFTVLVASVAALFAQ